MHACTKALYYWERGVGRRADLRVRGCKGRSQWHARRARLGEVRGRRGNFMFPQNLLSTQARESGGIREDREGKREDEDSSAEWGFLIVVPASTFSNAHQLIRRQGRTRRLPVNPTTA